MALKATKQMKEKYAAIDTKTVVEHEVTKVGCRAPQIEKEKIQGLTWSHDQFRIADLVDGCWQQHERSRTVCDWLSAWYHATEVKTFNDYVNSAPSSVNQLAFLLFASRHALAKYHYNDVIKAVQGPYSLHPKWLESATLGFLGEIVQSPSSRRVKQLEATVGLTTLLKVKFDENQLSADKAEKLIVECYRLWLEALENEPETAAYYKKMKPILAFKVEDTATKKCFFDVTNVSIDVGEGTIKIKRNASKPDVVSTNIATEIRKTSLEHIRDLALLMDTLKRDFLKDSQYIAWGEKIANAKPQSIEVFREMYTNDKVFLDGAQTVANPL